MNESHLKKSVALAIFAAFVDLWTKIEVFSFLSSHPGYRMELLPFLNLVSVTNTGVSFGMFSEAENGPMLLTVIGAVIVVILLGWLWNLRALYESLAIGLIIGGALGNIVDRVANGWVFDFIDLHAFGEHWPAFNVADSLIFCGVAWLLWLEYKRPPAK